ncbi:MAG: 50S ribosomal protein L33 [Bacilli bacterium]|nr:50S ribosomal protein L33 [Bacilli bacterium]
MNKKVILACTVCLNRNYSTMKNTFKHPERLEIMKYCKYCNKHTLHKETK